MERFDNVLRVFQRVLQRVLLARGRTLSLAVGGLLLLVIGLFLFSELPLFDADEVAEDPALGQARLSSAGVTDLDGDLLPDVVENYVTGTNSSLWDSTGDGVPDGWLWRYNQSPRDPTASSAWAAYPGPDEAPSVYGPDGLSQEYRLTYKQAYLYERPEGWNEATDGPNPNALNPEDWRSASGLPIPWLVHFDLPLDQDPDVVLDAPGSPGGPRFTVREAYEAGTDPWKADSDGDGLLDVEEVDVHGTDPARFSTSGAGIADGWLHRFGLDLFNATVAFQDPDQDGLSNREEFLVSQQILGVEQVVQGEGLSPNELSSSGSGLPDGWLVAKGLDPLDPDIASQVIDRSRNHDLQPGGETPPSELVLPEVSLTVAMAYTYDRPPWWQESANGVWWGGLDPTGGDTDQDGLPDVIELRGWHIHENRTGMDGRWLQVASDPRAADSDDDGLTDLEEFFGTVSRPEEEGAGVVERSFRPTDPNQEDSDFDGLTDGFEALTPIPGGSALDPMNPDTDGDSLEDGREWNAWEARSQRYARTGAYEFNGTHAMVTDWLQNVTWVQEQGVSVDRNLAPELFAPTGDLDGDGTPNILDRDSDGDGLDDGWEVDPTLYRNSPFASPFPRSATDPGNRDTDGDELPDAWEVEHGLYGPSRGGWNLDPAAWSSLRDGVSDADQDLDGDGTVWYTYDRGGQGLLRTAHEFPGTNRQEYIYGTDPNEPDSDDDGLLDGWEIFWGAVYPGLSPSQLGQVYPGAPGELRIPTDRILPDPTAETVGLTSALAYQRVSKDPTVIERWGEGQGSPSTFSSASGEQVTTYLFTGQLEYRLADHQKHATNPFLDDADDDGMPDAWELLANLNAPTGEALDPTVWDAAGDPDGDGLSNVEEHLEGTDPFRRDTDHGGVDDRRETRLFGGSLDPMNGADDRSLLNVDVDTDMDGLSDARELFETGTNMTNVDTDHDGLVDGPDLRFDPHASEDKERLEGLRANGIVLVERGEGVVALGEGDAGTDPTDWDTNGDGLPDGWQTHHSSADPAFYMHCRPSQWDEEVMGPWRWGLDPDDPGHDRNDPPVDLDRDGLHDLLGEDPYPCATPEVRPPLGVPWADGLSPDQRLDRARNYALDADQGALEERDAGQSNAIPDVRDRARTRMVLEAVDGHPYDGQQITLVKGLPTWINGRLLVDERDPRGALLNDPGTPVPNATIIAAVNGIDNLYGIAFTGPDGRFNLTANLAANHQIEIPTPGMVALGADRGSVSWSSNPDAIEIGTTSGSQPNVLLVRSYNTSASVEPGHPTFYRFTARLEDADGRTRTVETHAAASAQADSIPLEVVSGAKLTLQVPEAVGTGGILEGWVTLEDDRARPLPSRTVRLGWDGGASEVVTTTANGSAAVELPVTVEELGPHEVTARFDGDPDGSVHGGFSAERVLVKNTPILHATASPREPAASNQLTIRGTLLDGGQPLANQSIEVRGPVRATLPTDLHGHFARAFEIPKGTEPGPARLTVSFPGSQTHNPVERAVDLTVLVPTSLALEAPAQLERGNTLPVRGVLLDAADRPLPQRTIQVRIGGAEVGSVTTGENGGYELPIPVPETATPGPQRIEARFTGGSLHLPSSNATHVLVTAGTVIEVGDTLAVRGGELTVEGYLLLENGAPASHRGLALAWQGTWMTQDVTDEQGQFRLETSLPADVPLGPTSLRIAFNGSQDASLLPSSLSLTIPVREAVLLALDQPTLNRGANQWTGLLTGSDGRPLAGQGISVHLDGDLAALAGTDDEGRFELRFSLPRAAPLTDHGVTVRFQGTDTLGPAQRSLNLPILTDAQLDFDPPVRIVVGESARIEGRVVDGAGTPVEGGTVTALLSESAVDHTEVQAGAFTLDIDPSTTTGLGSKELVIRYTGTRHVLPTETTTTVDLVAPVSMEVDIPSKIEPGQVLQARVQLSTGEGDPVGNAPIFFQASENALVRVVYTDEQGHADVPVQADQGGELSYLLWYPGTDTLSPTSAQAQTNAAFPLSGTGLSLAALAAILAGLGLSAALLSRQWSRRTQEIATVLDEALDALLSIEDRARAIELAYERFERIAQVGGVEASASTTPREVAERLTKVLPIASESAHQVATTFEHALFSNRTATEDDREAIIESLRHVRDEVRALVQNPPEPTEGDEAEGVTA